MQNDNNRNLSASQIAVLDKSEVIRELVNFKGRFTLDYTPDYLQKLSVDRLRHILFAAILINQRKKKVTS